MELNDEDLDRAARAVADADAILIGAGAGMGVDSGLPDFRGNAGFWKAYPPFQALGLDFMDLANPRWFRDDPGLAWGFYGHRMNLYRATEPHAGFARLLRWARSRPGGAFVFTSNVDGQFQRAGFGEEEVIECHGSIHRLQCTRPCSLLTWDSAGDSVIVDAQTFRAAEPLPRCPRCDALARPNILMFGDGAWLPGPTEVQQQRMQAWLDGVQGARVVVIEAGAGTAIPSVRWTCERAASGERTLVRINPREPQVPDGHLSFAAGADAVLAAIDARLPTSSSTA